MKLVQNRSHYWWY